MATAALIHHQHPWAHAHHQHQHHHHLNSSSSSSTSTATAAALVATPPGAGAAGVAAPGARKEIPKRNEVPFNREGLIPILEFFSQCVGAAFNNRQIRLVVHGGACMLLHDMLHRLSTQQHQLHPTLPHRTSTRDVDYIHRSFLTEMAQQGVLDAEAKIKDCIRRTAETCGLGLDWMNSDADVALPFIPGPNGTRLDPIYHASIQSNNINLHTIFRSKNGLLTLISVTPFWAVSLKLVRYTPQDAADICLLLR
ncbi:hypothetical protein FA15DRAFT_517106 [Coprinopsis marcescibilis]|uniref:Uncharacterized protein n=1 Tax=Coprinopsis marcescibilis TaxID=230819 RepID=A0A5C3KPN6_COPMA|nr:hypothetical protein FA15DRAFT_517106 [Coprinopsis marcescibilis]